MRIDDIDWAEWYGDNPLFAAGRKPGSEESREHWNQRAPHFGSKPDRSVYIDKLMQLLDLQEDETLFDMGCGSGALAVPVAQEGHRVIAVDFSPGMLAELKTFAEAKGVDSLIEIHNNSWQEDLSDLPIADVAVSSRSFAVDDLADGIEKLESHARSRAAITCGAGDRPFICKELLEAMGKPEVALEPMRELPIIANFLWSHGRRPTISYIEYPGSPHYESREEAEAFLRRGHDPENEQQEEAFQAFLDEHLSFDEAKGKWELDAERTNRWGVLVWPIP